MILCSAYFFIQVQALIEIALDKPDEGGQEVCYSQFSEIIIDEI